MSRRFVAIGFLLAALIGLQTAWLINSNLEGPIGRAAFSVLIVLHLPAAALEIYVRPGDIPVLLLIALDCLLWGFGLAWAASWLKRTLSRPDRADR